MIHLKNDTILVLPRWMKKISLKDFTTKKETKDFQRIGQSQNPQNDLNQTNNPIHTIRLHAQLFYWAGGVVLGC